MIKWTHSTCMYSTCLHNAVLPSPTSSPQESPRQYSCQCGPHRFRLVLTLTTAYTHSNFFIMSLRWRYEGEAWRASVKQAYALMHQLTILTCPCHQNVIILLVSNCHIWDSHGHIIEIPECVRMDDFTMNFRMLQFQILETIHTSEAKLRQPLIRKEPIWSEKMLTEEKMNEKGTRL